MTLLELLSQVTGISAEKLATMLEQVGDKVPDSKPVADAWLAKLQEAITPQTLLAMFTALPAELSEAARGHFASKDHPSDAV